MDNQMVPFAFEGMSLKESCWMEGKPYFTYRAIGEFLEYRNSYKAILKIVDRNPHIKQFATNPKLGVVEGGRNVTRAVEVVDPIGLQLIINKSNQPRAIDFQIAAAHLVLAFMQGKLVPSKWSQKGDLVSAARQILSLPQGSKRRKLIEDLAEREDCSIQTAYRRIEMSTGERLKSKKGEVIHRSNKGTHNHPEEAKKLLDTKRANPGLNMKEIWKLSSTKYSLGNARVILRELTPTLH